MKHALMQALPPLIALGLFALTWAMGRALAPAVKADRRGGSSRQVNTDRA